MEGFLQCVDLCSGTRSHAFIINPKPVIDLVVVMVTGLVGSRGWNQAYKSPTLEHRALKCNLFRQPLQKKKKKNEVICWAVDMWLCSYALCLFRLLCCASVSKPFVCRFIDCSTYCRCIKELLQVQGCWSSHSCPSHPWRDHRSCYPPFVLIWTPIFSY